MPAKEPRWWYGPPESMPARLLAPLSKLWARTAGRRLAEPPRHRSSLPVVCIGNFTAGGTGKTPLALLVAGLLAARGERPVFLTRGYGGRIAGPYGLKRGIDTAADVGDEPLLLAAHGPVVVSRDRAAGARFIERQAGIGAPTVIVMDDGLQNPALAKDLVLAVVDGRRGFGNGRVMPAGPLRAPLAPQLALADAIVVNRPPGDTASAVTDELRRIFDGPVLEASVAPAASAPSLAGLKLLAVAGIANPARFTRLLAEHGADIAAVRTFADHHAFTTREAEALLAEAARLGARIVTTEKDRARLEGTTGSLARLKDAMITLPVELTFDARDHLRLVALIDAMLAKRRLPSAPAP